MRNLALFGDSWTVGDELNPDEKTYGELLANMLGYTYQNHGVSGASNDEIFLQLQNYCKNLDRNNHQTTAIILITSPLRSLYIDDDVCYQLFPRADKSDGDRNYYYFKYFQSLQQEKLRLELCLNALHNLCNQYNINDYYAIGWADIDLTAAGICKDKFLSKTCAELFDAPAEHEFTNARDNKYIYPNNCHPNQLGHQLIAESLYKWIQDAKD